jgi:hypothetical protein
MILFRNKMSNKITIKRSAVPGKVPQPGDLEFGEFAVNYHDGNLFFKNSSNTVSTLASTQFVNVSGNVTGGNIISLGSLSTVGTATIGAFTLPNIDGTPGQTLTTYGNGVVHWSTSGGSVSGIFNVFTRSGSIAVSVIAGFFDVTTRNGGVLKVSVS